MELVLGMKKAIELIIGFDREVVEITLRSLWISSLSCLLSALVALPLAFFSFFYRFPGRRFLMGLCETLYALPTVLVGLLLLILLSGSGPLGGLRLLFTPWAMVIGQVLFVSPLVLGLSYSVLSAQGTVPYLTALSLGAGRLEAMWVVLREAKGSLLSVLLMGFGRALSEVGCAIMVGGNIRGHTRVLTTAIALEASKGDFVLAFALGLLLLLLSATIIGATKLLGRTDKGWVESW